MRRIWVLLVPLMVLCTATVRSEEAMAPAEQHHTMLDPASLQWGPAPPGLPAGSQLAVLAGDPSKEGPFTLRAKLPDGYKVPPHWHSKDEHVTVLSGKLHMGMGDTMDAPATALGPGGFFKMPAKSHHYARAEGETVIQLHGVGPFDINYINAADDPRQGGAK